MGAEVQEQTLEVDNTAVGPEVWVLVLEDQEVVVSVGVQAEVLVLEAVALRAAMVAAVAAVSELVEVAVELVSELLESVLGEFPVLAVVVVIRLRLVLVGIMVLEVF